MKRHRYRVGDVVFVPSFYGDRNGWLGLVAKVRHGIILLEMGMRFPFYLTTFTKDIFYIGKL